MPMQWPRRHCTCLIHQRGLCTRHNLGAFPAQLLSSFALIADESAVHRIRSTRILGSVVALICHHRLKCIMQGRPLTGMWITPQLGPSMLFLWRKRCAADGFRRMISSLIS
jgi:hypothetical protein